MKNFLRMLGLALLTFVFLGGGRGLFSSAEVNEPSQTFTLGTNVKAIWDQSTQILTIQPTSSGTGKIDRTQWDPMVNKLQLRTEEIEEIEFKPGVLLPDGSDDLFSSFKSNIIFPEDQDTHNIVSMRRMFWEAEIFDSDLSKWDVSNVTNMEGMFYDADFDSDLSKWDVSNVTNMKDMFGATNFNSDLSKWDVSNVTNMQGMFYGANFTSDISKWDVSNVTNMNHMFYATNFNSDISKWDVSNVTNMEGMFQGARNFNSDISKWDVSNVTDMKWMFASARNFNSDISKWDVSNVTNMEGMFHGARNFNSDISKWDVSNVTNMKDMFYIATNFTSDLSKWDVGKVTNMKFMFSYATEFTSDISKWDVSNVTDMQWMFAGARNFNSDISKWDVSNVTNMNYMFWEAEIFDSDLSKWDFSSVAEAQGFISDTYRKNRKMSFSTENHDTLLQKLEDDYLAGKLDPNKLGRIDIQAKYCASYPLRDRLETYGFKIYSDMFNCNPVLKINSPTTQSSGTIVDTTISFESDFPLNEGDLPAALYVDPSNTTVEYSDFTCSLDSDPKKINCTIKIISTHEKANQKLTIKFVKELGTGRKIEASATANYLIDTQAPELAQLKIDTTAGINTPTVTLSQLPGDQGGAGTEKCELSYIDADGANQLSPLSVGVAQSLNLNSSEAVHTLEVTCYDKVGNSSTNTIKFPPIIEFSDENITLSKNDMQGTFTVYSPSGTPIQTISIEDPDGTQVQLGTCTSQEDNGTSAPWKNSQEKPVICDFSNVTKSGTIVVKAKDSTGAEGKNSQSFMKDITEPTIDIQPEPLLTGGEIPFVITITDDQGIDAGGVTINDSETTMGTGGFLCEQVSDSKTNVKCTFTEENPIVDGKLTVKVTDKAGNSTSLTKSGYTIDKTAPTISDIGKTDSDQGKKWTVSFSVKDEGGAGLWKEDEKNDSKYDDSAITWGVGEDKNCQNYEMISALNPQSSESFNLNFEFTDVSQNGRYLCIVAKDKVGNAHTGYLTDPININVAPTLGDASTTLDENAPIGTEVFTLNGVDGNTGDILSYDIISGNTGNVFTIDANKLKVNGALDYETLSGYTLVVQVKDQFGLSSTGSYTITLNDIDETVPSGGYSGGGGGSSHSSTSSSSTSTSSTQQKPETPSNAEPVKTEQVKTEVFNPTIQTTCFNPLDKQTIDQGNKISELLRIAHQMLYSYSLTKWQGTKDFAPGRSLTREEAARFMTEFATNVLCRKASRSYNDHFTDLEKANPELLPYIKKSYEYLIFNGDKNADGKKEKTTFRPKELITVGELSAIMTRLVRNELLEEVKGDRARNYKLYISSITPKSHLVDEVRGTVAEVIYDVYRNNSYELKDIGYVIKK